MDAVGIMDLADGLVSLVSWINRIRAVERQVDGLSGQRSEGGEDHFEIWLELYGRINPDSGDTPRDSSLRHL